MLKLFSIFSLVLMYFTVVNGQVVNIPITISNNLGQSAPIYFGLDLTATDGLDLALGEDALPGLPPGGYFAAWLFPDFTTLSYRDYRAPGATPPGSFPFTGHVSYIIRIQTDIPAGNPMTISWDLPPQIGATSTIGSGANIVSFSGTGSHTWNYNPVNLQYIFVEVDYDAIIPVELVSFYASVSGSLVNLTWTTATETNNSGFEVQRKTANTDWNKIGFVEGAGTTTEIRSYSFSDSYSGQGTVSYRLKQIDFDGTSTFSKAVAVDLGSPSESKLNQNYPNPFNPSTTVSFTIPKASSVKLIIYNQIGQKVGELVNKNLEAGSYSYNWNAENQSSGMYFYELQANEFKSVRKMTLIK